ncbi:hypothetical protein LJR038_000673 [Acidovorax sp. LjRoot38]|uniref:hypothetical protein n=1 Tax=Acidovorax sp. LjRoot38 TaxID=3342327 RepID=UPI003ECF0698
MKKPQVGQVLATRDGHKFQVADVSSTHDADDPDSDPSGFMVYLAPVDGLHVVVSAWDDEGLLDAEFEEWCRINGVSY